MPGDCGDKEERRDMPSVVQSSRIEPAQGADEKMAVTVNINLCPSFSGFGCSISWLSTKMKPIGKIFQVQQTTCGAVQLVLGVLCFTCGGLIFSTVDIENYREYYSPIIMERVPFWTGGLFLLSGVISIISEKFPMRFWVLLTLLMNLTSTCAAIPGIVFCAQQLSRIPDIMDYYSSSICRDWTYHGNYSDPLFNLLENCRHSLVERLEKVYANVFILLLVIISCELCVTVYSMGNALKTMCCSKPLEQDKNVMLEDSALESKSKSNLPTNQQEFQSLLDI